MGNLTIPKKSQVQDSDFLDPQGIYLHSVYYVFHFLGSSFSGLLRGAETGFQKGITTGFQSP